MASLPDVPMMNASPCEAVVKGTCVMILDDAIVYAGPIVGAPNTTGRLVLMSPDDFERFKNIVEKKRH